MFHFPGCPSHGLLIHPWMTAHYHSRVPPFGYPGIKAYLQLPQAFRSLSRPSSAISALASTLRSYSLDLSILQIVCQFSTTTFLRLLRSGCCSLICVSSVSFDPLPTGFFRFSNSTSQKSVSFLCSFQGANARTKFAQLGVRNEESGIELAQVPSPFFFPEDSCEPSKRYRLEIIDPFSVSILFSQIVGSAFASPTISIGLTAPLSICLPFSLLYVSSGSVSELSQFLIPHS